MSILSHLRRPAQLSLLASGLMAWTAAPALAQAAPFDEGTTAGADGGTTTDPASTASAMSWSTLGLGAQAIVAVALAVVLLVATVRHGHAAHHA